MEQIYFGTKTTSHQDNRRSFSVEANLKSDDLSKSILKQLPNVARAGADSAAPARRRRSALHSVTRSRVTITVVRHHNGRS